MKLFGDRSTADTSTALENECFQSTLREVAGSNEPIVTSTNNC